MKNTLKPRTIADWSGRKCYRSKPHKSYKILRDKYCCSLCMPAKGKHFGYNPNHLFINFYWSKFRRDYESKIVWRYRESDPLKSLSVSCAVSLRTKRNTKRQWKASEFHCV